VSDPDVHWIANRLMLSWPVREVKLSPGQVAAVLHGLADFTSLVKAQEIVLPALAPKPDSWYANERQRTATTWGRYFHALGDALEFAATGVFQ